MAIAVFAISHFLYQWVSIFSAIAYGGCQQWVVFWQAHEPLLVNPFWAFAAVYGLLLAWASVEVCIGGDGQALGERAIWAAMVVALLLCGPIGLTHWQALQAIASGDRGADFTFPLFHIPVATSARCNI